MKHFDWTAWIVAAVITFVFVIHTVRVWIGKSSSGYAEGRNSEESVNAMVRRFAKGYAAISGIFVSFVVLTISRHGADVIENKVLSDVLNGVFFFSCVVLGLAAIASVSIVLSGGPEFLVPPPLRGD
jgi:hypothetical protein